MGYNDSSLKEIRQYLRNNPTLTEELLWKHLKNKELGYKFQRQYGIDGYVVDFYCPELRLAIEIDGGYHFTPDVIEYDQQRQDYIEAYDIRFLRFTNEEIYEDINKVLSVILKSIEEHS